MIPAAAAARWAIARSWTARPTLLNRVISSADVRRSLPAGEIGEIAGDPVPRPRALLDGEVQVAGLGPGGGDVVDGDRRSRDQIAADLAQVEAVRTDQVDVRAGSHIGEPEERRVRPGRRAHDVARRGLGVGAGSGRLAGGNAARRRPARRAPAVRPATTTRSMSGRTTRIACTWATACGPVPMMPTERTSARARASVASAEIIGVRRVVSAAPSSRATGWPIAHVEQHVHALDDRQPACRIGRLDADQFHAGRVAGSGGHHQELAAARAGSGPDRRATVRPRNRRATRRARRSSGTRRNSSSASRYGRVLCIRAIMAGQLRFVHV